MISVPAKETEPADWAGFLKSYLRNEYGSADDFTGPIEQLNQQRQAISDAPQLVSGRDLLYRYYGQLELLSMRIPVVRVNFSWKNAFDDEWQSQQSLAFEKACVLFNLAATFSAIGATAIASSDPKGAYAPFQAAASVFKFISESFLHAPSSDLQPDTTAALSLLMLAQAQEAALMKASEKPAESGQLGLRAKLASAAAQLYDQAADALKWGSDEWPEEMRATAKQLRARAHRDWGLNLERLGSHGEAIGHLRYAQKLGEGELSSQIKALERDNELVWHEAVPAESEVSVVPATQMAKPTAMEALFTAADASRIVGRDLFSRIVPMAVHEKASMYSEMQAGLIRGENDKADVADQELQSALEYMDLPQAATKLTTAPEAGVPADFIGVDLPAVTIDFEPQRKRILGLCSAVGDPHQAQQIKQGLVNAMGTDSRLRELAQSVQDDVETLRDTAKVTSLFETPAVGGPTPPQFDLLSLDDLPSGGSSTSLENQVSEIVGIVARLRKAQGERRVLLRELRDKVHADDISSVLVAHQNTANIEEAVFWPEMEKYTPIVKRMDATIRLQASLLDSVSNKWRTLLNTPEAKNKIKEYKQLISHREELCSRFKFAIKTWDAVRDGSGNAQSFYAQLEQLAVSGAGNRRGSSSREPALMTVTTANGAPPLPPKPTIARLDSQSASLSEGQSGYTTPSAYNPSFYS